MRTQLTSGKLGSDWYVHFFTGAVHAAQPSLDDSDMRLWCDRATTVNMTSTDVDNSEMKTGLMCMQCSSAMKRDSLCEEERDSNLDLDDAK